MTDNFLLKNRKVHEYTNLDSNDYEEKTEEIKILNKNKLENIFLKAYKKIKSFYLHIMNRSEDNIRNLFFLLLFVFWIERLLMSLTVKFILKLGIYYGQIFD